MVKEDILNLCEGRFEKMIQMGNEGKKMMKLFINIVKII